MNRHYYTAKIFAGLALFCLILLCTTADTWSAIDAVEWGGLSDQDISPQGRAALSIDKSSWSHAQTGHFIYHFTDDRSAETVYLHAETYYGWIKDFFGVPEDRWSKKIHIFIFSSDDKWQEFLKRINSKGAPAAFTTGWELFINRKPFWASPRFSLAHELTHVIMFKFAEGPLPTFLNEGFANFVSGQLVKMQLESMGYEAGYEKPISAGEYIPLKELSAMTDYPEGRIEVFYRESTWLVRYIVSAYGKEKLYEILRLSAQGEGFSAAVDKSLGVDQESLEEKFKTYSISGK